MSLHDPPANDHTQLSGVAGDEEGRMTRPEATVLGTSAMVPAGNLVDPAPNRFTHELAVDEPFWLEGSDRTGPADGVLPAGAPVVVLVDGDIRSRVVAGTGLYVDVRRASLRPIADH